MLLLSPILNRELLTFLRSKRAFGGLLLFLLILSAAAGICWWATLLGGRVTERDLLSRNLFYTITIVQLLIFSLYALILTCTRINAERDEKTLDLLVTAPLSILHIILAKYAAALTVILLLVVASVPALSLCFLLGGVSAKEVLSTYSIILLAVLTYGMIGMACSTIFRKNYVSLGVAFVVYVIFYYGAGVITYLFLNIIDLEIVKIPDHETIAEGVLMTTSPFGAYAVANSAMGLPMPLRPLIILILHTAFQVLTIVVSFLIAWLGLRSLAGRTSQGYQRRELRRASRESFRAASQVAAGTTKRSWLWRRDRPIGDRINPVFAREDRLFLSRRWKHRLLRYALAAGAFLLGWAILAEALAPRQNYSFENFMLPLGAMTVVLLIIFVPLLAARAVTSECETHSLPLLVVTPLRPGQVLLGKMVVVLKHSFRAVLLFTFLLVLISTELPAGGYWQILLDWIRIVPPLFAILFCFISLGLFFSVLCRRTVTAVVLTYAIILTLALAPFITMMVLDVTSYMSNAPERLGFRAWFRFVTPIISPGFFFVNDSGVNFWHANHLWRNILGYSAVMLIPSIALFLLAEFRFARMYYYGVRAMFRVTNRP